MAFDNIKYKSAVTECFPGNNESKTIFHKTVYNEIIKYAFLEYQRFTLLKCISLNKNVDMLAY